MPDAMGESAQVAGGSDGNLTAALGIPTLDSLGVIRAHPHARDERADVAAMPDRVALLTGLINRLTMSPARSAS